MKKTVDWKKFWKYFGCSILLLFLVVGVPVIINELYKLDCGYLTVWSGADVLGYYGTLVEVIIAIIGVGATIWSLRQTIEFTRKQIKHDTYIQNQYAKWYKIEELLLEAIACVQPYKLANVVLSEIVESNGKFENIELLKQIGEANIALEQLLFYIDQQEENALEIPLTTLREFINTVTSYYGDIEASETKEEYNSKCGDFCKRLIEMEASEYCTLLEQKRVCFNVIYENIENKSNEILKLKEQTYGTETISTNRH